MLRITVAFIVVTLTGLPVLPAMCHNWCGEDKATTGPCHDEAVGNGSAAVITGTAACMAMVTDDPFIREDARPVLHTVQYLPAAGTALALRSTTPPVIVLLAGRTHDRPKAPLVLRV